MSQRAAMAVALAIAARQHLANSSGSVRNISATSAASPPHSVSESVFEAAPPAAIVTSSMSLATPPAILDPVPEQNIDVYDEKYLPEYDNPNALATTELTALQAAYRCDGGCVYRSRREEVPPPRGPPVRQIDVLRESVQGML